MQKVLRAIDVDFGITNIDSVWFTYQGKPLPFSKRFRQREFNIFQFMQCMESICQALVKLENNFLINQDLLESPPAENLADLLR